MPVLIARLLLIGYSWVLTDWTNDMKKVLLGFGLVLLLSACGTGNEPVVETDPDNTVETSEQALENEVVAEPEETVVAVDSEPVAESEPEPIVEPEPDIPEDDSMVESKSSDMDFSTCLQQQAEFTEAVSSSGNYNVISIVDTEILSMVKFCTNDDSVIHTCSAPDNKMIVTKSTNREGC